MRHQEKKPHLPGINPRWIHVKNARWKQQYVQKDRKRSMQGESTNMQRAKNAYHHIVQGDWSREGREEAGGGEDRAVKKALLRKKVQGQCSFWFRLILCNGIYYISRGLLGNVPKYKGIESLGSCSGPGLGDKPTTFWRFLLFLWPFWRSIRRTAF